MKTGLITFHSVHHYGAQLQAYALMKAIGDIAGDCEIIDYRRLFSEQANRVMQAGYSPYTMLKNMHSLLHYPALHRRYRRFSAFINADMVLSPRRYASYEELCAHAPVYDKYVCGSDQIWNPFLFEDQRFDKSFFLQFASASPKIAYAPSIGAAKLSAEMKQELQGYLDDFAHLSVREKRGAAVIEEITKQPVPVMLDPTLLLSEQQWGGLAGQNRHKQPYVLCYFVSPPGNLAPLVEEAKKYCQAGAVQLAGARRKVRGINKVVFDAGPREFLALFQNAAYVITNSFHGAVFAIQFRKPFVCGAGRGESDDPGSSRMGNLLETLGLPQRLYSGGFKDILQQPPDYAFVRERLETERARSLQYLRTALNG